MKSAAMFLSAAWLGACAPYPLHSGMTTQAVQATLAREFHAGMTYTQTNTRLTSLRVPERFRHTYAAGPPREMVARVFPAGGFWVSEPDQLIEWYDLTFAFDEADRLTGLWVYDGGARYIDGYPSDIRPSPTLAPAGRYPTAPPPPLNPPAGEAVPLRDDTDRRVGT